MTAFGIKKFSPAKFNDQIKTAANSSDPKTRTEAMNCYKAIFLWVGEAGAVEDAVADAVESGVGAGAELVDVVDGESGQAGQGFHHAGGGDRGPEEEEVGVAAGEIHVDRQ